MTALYMDSFDQYGTGPASTLNMLDGVWGQMASSFQANVPYWGAARTGNYCLACHDSTQNPARLVLPTSPQTMYISFGFAIDTLPTYNGNEPQPLTVRDNNNNVLYNLCVTTTGALQLNNGSGTPIATTTPVIRVQTWHFFEICVDFSAGEFTVRLDDSTASLTPIMTAGISTSGSTAQVSFTTGGGGNGCPAYWDDLFIRDNTGTTNNGWLGDRRIALLMADQDTTTMGWSPTYYNKYGTGVLALATMPTNSNIPNNINAFLDMPGLAAYNIGASDFTYETWVRFEQLPVSTGYTVLGARWDAINNARSWRFSLGGTAYNNGCLQFDYSTDGTSNTQQSPIVYPFSPMINEWYHIAVVRASGEMLLFVNGQQLGLPLSVPASFYAASGNPLTIGAEAGNNGLVQNTYLTGLMDETRFTNGYARYTAPFTPPAAAFPRGSADPQWADVAFLAGYNGVIQDESSYNAAISAYYGASSFVTNDGPAVGNYSTVGKQTPDDNTFMAASFLPATGILTMTKQPANGDTVTVGSTTSGNAVYTFKTAIANAYDVLIDTSAENTLLNLYNAINLGPGLGTKYGSGTLANAGVSATQLPAGQIEVSALISGTSGNSIESTSTGTAAVWGASTLSGGVNIPGPSNFYVQRPPPNTTIVSAIQLTVRANKSDAGTCTLKNAFVGGKGGVAQGTTHNLATNPGYYLDMIQTDPDTGNPLSPTTVINGTLQINRTS